jgi:hypothetical protein
MSKRKNAKEELELEDLENEDLENEDLENEDLENEELENEEFENEDENNENLENEKIIPKKKRKITRNKSTVTDEESLDERINLWLERLNSNDNPIYYIYKIENSRRLFCEKVEDMEEIDEKYLKDNFGSGSFNVIVRLPIAKKQTSFMVHIAESNKKEFIDNYVQRTQPLNTNNDNFLMFKEMFAMMIELMKANNNNPDYSKILLNSYSMSQKIIENSLMQTQKHLFDTIKKVREEVLIPQEQEEEQEENIPQTNLLEQPKETEEQSNLLSSLLPIIPDLLNVLQGKTEVSELLKNPEIVNVLQSPEISKLITKQ